jgi:hypothetical protein
MTWNVSVKYSWLIFLSDCIYKVHQNMNFGDIITELNISNIATASETFVRECDE